MSTDDEFLCGNPFEAYSVMDSSKPPESKRQSRNDVERKRKEKIKSFINQLNELLPSDMFDCKWPTSNNSILEKSVKYIKILRHQNELLLEDKGIQVQAEEILRLKNELNVVKEQRDKYEMMVRNAAAVTPAMMNALPASSGSIPLVGQPPIGIPQTAQPCDSSEAFVHTHVTAQSSVSLTSVTPSVAGQASSSLVDSKALNLTTEGQRAVGQVVLSSSTQHPNFGHMFLGQSASSQGMVMVGQGPLQGHSLMSDGQRLPGQGLIVTQSGQAFYVNEQGIPIAQGLAPNLLPEYISRAMASCNQNVSSTSAVNGVHITTDSRVGPVEKCVQSMAHTTVSSTVLPSVSRQQNSASVVSSQQPGLVAVPGHTGQLPSAIILPNGQIIPVVTQASPSLQSTGTTTSISTTTVDVSCVPTATLTSSVQSISSGDVTSALTQTNIMWLGPQPMGGVSMNNLNMLLSQPPDMNMANQLGRKIMPKPMGVAQQYLGPSTLTLTPLPACTLATGMQHMAEPKVSSPPNEQPAAASPLSAAQGAKKRQRKKKEKDDHTSKQSDLLAKATASIFSPPSGDPLKNTAAAEPSLQTSDDPKADLTQNPEEKTDSCSSKKTRKRAPSKKLEEVILPNRKSRRVRQQSPDEEEPPISNTASAKASDLPALSAPTAVQTIEFDPTDLDMVLDQVENMEQVEGSSKNVSLKKQSLDKPKPDSGVLVAPTVAHGEIGPVFTASATDKHNTESISTPQLSSKSNDYSYNPSDSYLIGNLTRTSDQPVDHRKPSKSQPSGLKTKPANPTTSAAQTLSSNLTDNYSNQLSTTVAPSISELTGNSKVGKINKNASESKLKSNRNEIPQDQSKHTSPPKAAPQPGYSPFVEPPANGHQRHMYNRERGANEPEHNAPIENYYNSNSGTDKALAEYMSGRYHVSSSERLALVKEQSAPLAPSASSPSALDRNRTGTFNSQSGNELRLSRQQDVSEGQMGQARGNRVRSEGNRSLSEISSGSQIDGNRTQSEGLRLSTESPRIHAEGQRMCSEDSRMLSDLNLKNAAIQRNAVEGKRMPPENRHITNFGPQVTSEIPHIQLDTQRIMSEHQQYQREQSQPDDLRNKSAIPQYAQRTDHPQLTDFSISSGRASPSSQFEYSKFMGSLKLNSEPHRHPGENPRGHLQKQSSASDMQLMCTANSPLDQDTRKTSERSPQQLRHNSFSTESLLNKPANNERKSNDPYSSMLLTNRTSGARQNTEYSQVTLNPNLSQSVSVSHENQVPYNVNLFASGAPQPVNYAHNIPSNVAKSFGETAFTFSITRPTTSGIITTSAQATGSTSQHLPLFLSQHRMHEQPMHSPYFPPRPSEHMVPLSNSTSDLAYMSQRSKASHSGLSLYPNSFEASRTSVNRTYDGTSFDSINSSGNRRSEKDQSPSSSKSKLTKEPMTEKLQSEISTYNPYGAVPASVHASQPYMAFTSPGRMIDSPHSNKPDLFTSSFYPRPASASLTLGFPSPQFSGLAPATPVASHQPPSHCNFSMSPVPRFNITNIFKDNSSSEALRLNTGVPDASVMYAPRPSHMLQHNAMSINNILGHGAGGFDARRTPTAMPPFPSHPHGFGLPHPQFFQMPDH